MQTTFRGFLRITLSALAAAILGAAAAMAQTTYEVVHRFRESEASIRPDGASQSRLIVASDGYLYGTTYWGGTTGFGTIYRMDAAGTTTTLHSFAFADGANPAAGLVEASNGIFYGTTSLGGSHNKGTVFRMDASGAVTRLHDFDGSGGAFPLAALIKASDGKFYGTTSDGGANGAGVVFRIDSSGGFELLHSFDRYVDGARPVAELIAARGAFYGTTREGGANNLGTVFRMNVAGAITSVHIFTGPDGASPAAALIASVSGDLYGTTSPSPGLSLVYRVDMADQVTTLHTFNPDTEGVLPLAPLIQASDGYFYGTLSGGAYLSPLQYGTVFRLTDTGTVTVLHAFDGTDGASPASGLVQTADGSLYGLTNSTYQSAGTVFRIDSSSAFNTLHSFGWQDGTDPAYLLQASDGYIYGTTSSGGTDNLGTVFRMDLAGNVTELRSLAGDGRGPANLMEASDGKIYGTDLGGANHLGRIFRLDPSGTTTTLHSFDGNDGAGSSGLVQASDDGLLYGTTPYTFFRIDTSGNFENLAFFSEACWDANGPPVEGGNGHFYGTARNGGAYGNGCVFDVKGDNVQVTYSFAWDGSEGVYPVAPLVDSDYGQLGTTFEGGEGYGTIFITSGGSFNLDTLHVFDGATEGGGPVAVLLPGGTGTASIAGPFGKGTIFQADPFTVLYAFPGVMDGGNPVYPLIGASDGYLYGTAGVIYRLTDHIIAANQILPTSGPPGGPLIVIGGGFSAGVTVTVGGLAGTNVTVVDSTFLHFLTPALSPGTYDVKVTAPGGASATLPAAYVVNAAPAPTITGFTPTAGPINANVTINGTGFTGVSSVKFNGKAAAFNVLSPTQLTANVPSGTTTGKITVTTPAGTATSATDFIVTSKPTVTGFTPGSGVPGTAVVITGTNFDTASAVAFNGAVWVAATFTINSPTQITATVPSTATTGKIKITNSAGVAYSAGAFVVPPTITSFSPTSGLAGTKVIINGNTFLHASSVTFNGVAATFTVNSAIKITATVPAGATSGKIVVTTPGGGTGTSATNFMVLPTITTFTPTAARVGTKITINGTGFTGVSSVRFNGKAAPFTVLSSTQLTANVPSTTSGKITVKTPAGTATSATDFIVAYPPTVTGFTPGSGVPGTAVVITGTNFETASAVAFNSIGATFTVNSPTQITATVPSGATTGRIKVTNLAGAALSAGVFLVPPTITSFSPTSGLAGTKVIINGTAFLNASSVTFNGVPATFAVNYSTKITATVPSGATSGKIAVTTPSGTATSATDFTVLP